LRVCSSSPTSSYVPLIGAPGSTPEKGIPDQSSALLMASSLRSPVYASAVSTDWMRL
jgi:hypothetical protein